MGRFASMRWLAIFLLCILPLCVTAVPQDYDDHTLDSSSRPSSVPMEEGETAGVRLRGAVPSSGSCPSESDTNSVGNHCVKLTGAKLTTFQKNTNQDFSSGGTAPTQWCVCLH